MGLFGSDKKKKPVYRQAIDDADDARGTFWNSTPSSAKGREITIKKRVNPGKAIARARARRRKLL